MYTYMVELADGYKSMHRFDVEDETGNRRILVEGYAQADIEVKEIVYLGKVIL